MPTFYRGADLIYRVRALYNDTNAVITVSTFSAITAVFSNGGRKVTYTLADGEITTEGNYLNIYIQRADFESKNQGTWDLKITTEETDIDFADNKRVRIGYILSAFNLEEV